jgi:hypothetical protein
LDHHYKIDSDEMVHHRRAGLCVKAYKIGEEECTPWTIDRQEALHECLAVYYKRRPDPKIQVIIKKEQEELIEKHLRTAAIHSNTQLKPSKKRKVSSPRKTKNKEQPETVVAVPDDDIGPCGKCGNPVGPVHKCDVCKKNMHTWCGRPLGEEGYGQFIRCPSCDVTPV